ncbi:MAG: 23S rRNA (guanosine(2251)-2'-O)-methyltransferase RlmB [Cytophagaceae bacterium]|nr:23S rRNA (guanosine(2251)-2'-O)-methyltransferase RlmB [Cytophagaceae bacterium]
MENRKRSGMNRGGDSTKKFYKPVNRPNKEDFVFGIQSVLETLRSGKEIDKVILQKDIKAFEEIETLAKEMGVPVQKAPLERLNRVTMKNHQGVVAFVSAVNFASLGNVITEAFESGEVPLVLILDRITDVRNFGAICRTAECCGANAIVVPARGGAQITGDAMKTSSGALNFVPICREHDLSQTVEYLRNSGFRIVSCTEKTENSLYSPDYTLPTAIIMGSEEDGISDTLLQLSDDAVRIPLKGKVESLNVSVATGIILYEVLRQREFQKSSI